MATRSLFESGSSHEDYDCPSKRHVRPHSLLNLTVIKYNGEKKQTVKYIRLKTWKWNALEEVFVFFLHLKPCPLLAAWILPLGGKKEKNIDGWVAVSFTNTFIFIVVAVDWSSTLPSPSFMCVCVCVCWVNTGLTAFNAWGLLLPSPCQLVRPGNYVQVTGLGGIVCVWGCLCACICVCVSVCGI